MRKGKKSLYKKLAAILAAFLLAGAAGGEVRAMAAADFPGLLEFGSLTIHKFRTDNFENLQDSTGREVDASLLPEGAQKMEGISFQLEKLLVPQEGVPQLDSPADPGFVPLRGETDSQGVLAFDQLEEGYYRVREHVPSGYSAQRESFLIKMPMGTEEDYNYDIHVYPKNMGVVEEHDVTKTVSSSRKVVGVGDPIRWTIRYPMGSDLRKQVTDSDGSSTFIYATNFYLTDTMDSRLDYIADSVRFRLFNYGEEQMEELTLTVGEDFLEHYDRTAHKVIWTFTAAGTQKIADNGVAYITASLQTKVNVSALETVKPLWNNAAIRFTNASGDPYEHEVFDPSQGTEGENVPHAYLGQILLDKQDEKNGEKLAGAVFKLAATAENAKEEIYIKRQGSQGLEEVQAVSDENGEARIQAIGAGTYYLIETKAPSGYERNSKPIKVIVGNRRDESTVSVTVMNTKKGSSDPGGNKTPVPTPGAGTVTPGEGSPGGSSFINKVPGVSGIIKSVKTGDVTAIAGWVFLLLGSGGLVYCLRKKQKTKEGLH